MRDPLWLSLRLSQETDLQREQAEETKPGPGFSKYSSIFSNISHINHIRRTSPQVSEQPFVDIGIHRLHIILEILGSDYLFVHIDIRVHYKLEAL